MPPYRIDWLNEAQADVRALDVAEDHGGLMLGHRAIHRLAALGAGEVEDVCPGGEAGARDLGVVGLDGDEHVGGPQLADDGQEAGVLRGRPDKFGVREGGFRADVHDGRALGCEDLAARDCGVGGEADAFAIPGAGGEVHHAHDGRLGVEAEFPAAECMRLLLDSGYSGWHSLEWEKMWHPQLLGPEIALPLFPIKLRDVCTVALNSG